MKIKLKILTVLILASHLYQSSPVYSETPRTNFPISDRCRIAIQKAKVSIEKTKAQIVYIRQFEQNALGYNDYPENRNLGYDIVLQNERRADGTIRILESPVFMNNLTTQIVSSCETVSSVSFWEYQSSFSVDFALMKNGKVEEIKCVFYDSRIGQKEPTVIWGQRACQEGL